MSIADRIARHQDAALAWGWVEIAALRRGDLDGYGAALRRQWGHERAIEALEARRWAA